MWPPHGKRSIVAGRAFRSRSACVSMPLTMRRRRPGAEQARQRLGQVAERRRQTPHPDPRAARSQARERELAPARRAWSRSARAIRRRRSRRRRAKRSRQSARDSSSVRLSGVVTSAVGSSSILPRPCPTRRVAGAHVDGPMRPQRLRGAGECETGIGGERAKRRQPEYRQRRRSVRRPHCWPRAAGRTTPHRSCPCRLAHVPGPIRHARTPPTPLPGNRRARIPVVRTTRAPARKRRPAPSVERDLGSVNATGTNALHRRACANRHTEGGRNPARRCN